MTKMTMDSGQKFFVCFALLHHILFSSSCLPVVYLRDFGLLVFDIHDNYEATNSSIYKVRFSIYLV